MNTGAAFFQ